MAEYVYNGFKKRVGRVESLNNLATATPTPHMPMATIQDPTSEVKYVLDMTRPYSNLLATKDTIRPAQSFVWGSSLLSAITSNDSDNGTSTSHYLQDHLGSPIRSLGDSGDDNPFAYDVFGEQIATPSAVQPFGFTGYQTDAVSGMHYAQARYYDPTIARFVSEDTVRDGMNYYQYCYANPLRFVDLNGLWGKDIHEEITRTAAENLYDRLGINLDAIFGEGFVDSLVHYNNETDSLYSGLGPITGNQAYHFNRSPYGERDSRLALADKHLESAINLMLGHGNFGISMLPQTWLRDSIHNSMRDVSGMYLFPFSGLHGTYALYIDSTFRSVFGPNMHDLPISMMWQLPGLSNEMVMMHLGAALHAIQDYHAHGQINAGPNRFIGHAPQTVQSLGSSLFYPFVAWAPNFDSANYEWVPGSRTRLRRTVNPDYNPRILAAIQDTEDFLLLLIMRTVDDLREMNSNSIGRPAYHWAHPVLQCVQ